MFACWTCFLLPCTLVFVFSFFLRVRFFLGPHGTGAALNGCRISSGLLGKERRFFAQVANFANCISLTLVGNRRIRTNTFHVEDPLVTQLSFACFLPDPQVNTLANPLPVFFTSASAARHSLRFPVGTSQDRVHPDICHPAQREALVAFPGLCAAGGAARLGSVFAA